MEASFTMMDSPREIAAYRVAMIRRALGIEVKTGMKVTRNMPTLKRLREQYNLESKTKAAMVVELGVLLGQIEDGVAFYEETAGIGCFEMERRGYA